MTTPSAAPADVDLRPLLPPVRDQGQRGTCVAFAVTAAHEMERASGALVTDDLSEEALYWGCKTADGNWRSGTQFGSAAVALTNSGQPLEVVWPYNTRQIAGVPFSPPTAPNEHWYRTEIGATGDVDLVLLRRTIGAGTPVMLGVSVYDTFFRPTPDARIVAPAPGAPRRGGHAVLAVGHDADGLLVRNSWGPSWADGGYGWLTNEYAEDHIREAWTVNGSGAAPAQAVTNNAGDIYGAD